jgi:hypothetical protein
MYIWPGGEKANIPKEIFSRLFMFMGTSVFYSFLAISPDPAESFSRIRLHDAAKLHVIFEQF